jgi:hypothetical protein
MWEKFMIIFRSAPAHGSRGRSAPQRLERALKQADSFGFELTTLRKISQEFEKP